MTIFCLRSNGAIKEKFENLSKDELISMKVLTKKKREENLKIYREGLTEKVNLMKDIISHDYMYASEEEIIKLQNMIVTLDELLETIKDCKTMKDFDARVDPVFAMIKAKQYFVPT